MKKLFLLAALMSATLILFAQPTGSKGGKFTVASGVQVRFSQGNLQFNVSQGTHQTADGSQPGTFRFAEHQYDTIGKSNTNIIEENYTGWISLFGWGTSGYNGKSPMMYVRDNAQYGDGTSDIAGTNYDWGVYNAISNGGNKPGLWRTPTREEYSYMLKNRANAELLWSKGTVNGITGFIFLPDDWTLPTGITFTPKARYDENVYSIEQWTQLENNGAIFIPREGYQNYSTSNLRMEYSTGNHYLATGSCKSTSSRYVLSGGQTDPSGSGCSTFRYTGVPVRLARTVEEFTVTYKDWDGTTLKTENVEYGFAATPPTSPTREGYTLTGWTASVSGMSKDYITDEVTFTAQYEKYITYTVTFVDGATNEILKVQQVKKGESATAPTIPTHTGWTSQGWDKSFTNVQSDLVVTALYVWDETAGRLNGKFTVANGKQVYFSKGNLMYRPSNNEWRFHAYQYDYNGDENLATNVNNANYSGWLDLFTWSNTDNNFGVTTSYDNYEGIFVDWGTNPIWNGGNKAYAWYTLSQEEWEYLFQTRTNAASKYSFATLNGSRGMVILPDDWTLPSGLSFTAKATDYTTNTYSANQWEQMEANGAVFLMQTAYREGTDMQSLASTGIGLYRSTGKSGFTWMKSGNNYVFTNSYQDYTAMSVRLVRSVNSCEKTSSFTATAIGSYVWEGMVYTSSGAFTRNFRTAQGCDSLVTLYLTISQEQPAEGDGLLNGQFSVSADQQVRFAKGNLQYKPAEKTWRFANNQYDIIGQYNSNIIDASYQGWIDLFLWSCTDNEYGTKLQNLTGDFVEWGNNRVLNGGNKENFWQTLTIDQWTYLLQNRTNAAQLWGKAAVNSINGVILLPDDWTLPAGLSFTPAQSNYESNVYTPVQWAQMEANGAVFLPATGDFSMSSSTTVTVQDWNVDGNYFSSDSKSVDGIWYGQVFSAPSITYAPRGSVRLVRMGECVAKTTSLTETACDSYTWDGTTYTESGDYQKSYITSTGCDSIVTLHLTINPSYETGFGEQAETSYTWQGTTYTESGDYTKTLQSVAGCDSIVTLHLTIGSDEPEDPIEYNLRVCGTRVTSANCADIAAAVDGVTGAVSYDPATNTLTLENATLTTPDVTQAIWNQIPELKIIVKGACDLNTPYCIALRIDANTTIEGSNADASLKVRNAGPLDHAIGSVAAGTCYTALATFNNASLTVKDCEVETEGAGGILLQGSSQLTVNHARLTALSIGTPTSDAQWNVMRSFKASVAPVLIDCELLAPEGVTFSTTLGGYTTDGSSLTREKVIIGIPEPEQKWTNGILPGKFSVSADKQVQFSQGNLQYKASENLWRFAPQQTDTIGGDNANISPTYEGWIDLFGWGTGSNPALATTNNTDYAVFTDWGVNAISNGGNEANLWRTLTAAEWEYLFRGRTNAEQLFSLGTVNGMGGCIILPDDWTAPEGITFNSILKSASWNEESGKYTDPAVCVLYEYNNFSASEWKQMEDAGAVFLVAAGVRNGADIEAKNYYGKYWASPVDEETIAKSILIDDCGFKIRFNEESFWGTRSIGGPVRLVQDIVEEVTPVGAMTWRADDEDIKDLGTIVENTTVRGLTFVATADKDITVDESKKTYDTITFTHRIKLGGTIGETYRHLKFDVPGNATIEIYAISGSSSATRQLNIAAGAYNSNLQQYDVTGTEVNYIKYEYTGDSTTIYLGSASSGINILGIVLTPKNTPTAIDNTPFPSGEGRGEASKLLINGQVYILRDGKYYNIFGVKVK